NITFDVLPTGNLSIGDHVNLSQDILITAAKSVTIGADTMIAGQLSIRDADHGTNSADKISIQALVAREISIGRDVWIGAGCTILKGAVIADGVVVGANSVVLSSSETQSYGIYAGTPVSLLR